MLGSHKIYIHYDAKTDYLEIVSQKGDVVAHDIGKGMFELKTSRGKIVGRAVIDASERLDELDFLDPLAKFSVQMKVARLKRGLT